MTLVVVVFTYSIILFSLYLRFNFDSGFGEAKSKTLGRLGMRRKHYSEGSSIRRSDAHSAAFEDDMEEELEKTKVVKAFWDLRQEVRKNFVYRSIFFYSS